MTLTIKAAIFRYKIETAVLILPVATMIAFAQLRASMPNAPVGFGKSSAIQSVTIPPTLMTRKTPYPQGTNLGQPTSLRPPKKENCWLTFHDEQMSLVHCRSMCV
jgi:hypothetical protein